MNDLSALLNSRAQARVGRSRWKRTASVKEVNPVWSPETGNLVFRDVSVDVGEFYAMYDHISFAFRMRL